MVKTVTVNLDDAIEKRFGEKARLKFGHRKEGKGREGSKVQCDEYSNCNDET